MRAKYKILFVSFCICWLLMLVFSFEYVSHQINKNNQQKFESIQQQAWHLNWSFTSKAEIVSSFSSDWQITGTGIKSTTAAPELSLHMNGAVIDPSIQQTLHIEADLESAIVAASTFKLEFSDQQLGIYYVSAELPLQALNQPLALNGLSWKVINPDDVESDGEFRQWSRIKALDALVVRFYFPKPSKLNIENIRILQTKAKDWAADPVVECQLMKLPVSACLINNQIRDFQDKPETVVGNQLIVYDTVSDMSPFMWLVSAVVVLVLTLLLTVGFQATIMSLVVGVFTAIAVLHQRWLETYFSYLQWPLLALMIGMLWHYRRSFKFSQRTALPVWLVTLLLVIIMLMSNQQQPLSFKLFLDLPQYLLWALVQQMLLGPLASQLLLRHLKVPVWLVACMVGVLFSVVHAPNHVLMLATLLGGVAWSYAWLKYENIYANAFSHAVLALVFYQVMPVAWLGTARVGVFF